MTLGCKGEEQITLDGKAISADEYRRLLGATVEVPDSRTSAKGYDDQGRLGFVVRFRVRDTAGTPYAIQEIETSAGKRVTVVTMDREHGSTPAN